MLAVYALLCKQGSGQGSTTYKPLPKRHIKRWWNICLAHRPVPVPDTDAQALLLVGYDGKICENCGGCHGD